MPQIDEKPVRDEERSGRGTNGSEPPPPPPRTRAAGGPEPRRSSEARAEGGFLRQHKPEQGKWTRGGTFVGAGALIAWGGYFAYDRLRIYEGDEAWRLLITAGIPLVLVVGLGFVAYWASYVGRKSSDFMIATEGEMKKVNWSTRREVIGSTKVVIVLLVMLALLLFGVDLTFQALFKAIGVLQVSG